MKSIILTALIASSIGVNFAQEDVVYVRVDKPKRSRENTDRTVDLYNVFKFDPIRLFVGEIKFGYERRVAEKSSVEFELGPTLSGIQSPFNIGNHYTNLYYQNQTTSKFGVVASIAYRYYPLDDVTAFNRFYVSPKFNFRNFNNEFIMYNKPGVSNVGYENHAQFTFNFGVQSWVAKSFAIDYYAGFGLANRSAREYSYSEVYNPNTGGYDIKEGVFHTSDNYWVLTMGLKFGIGK